MEVSVTTKRTRFCREYGGRADYKKYALKILKNDDDLEYVLANACKAIMFVGNRERGKTLAEEQNAKDKNSAEFLEARDKATSKTAQSLETFHRFESKILFVTKVLDVGVSIEDPGIDTIIIDPTTRINFLQMLARVRLQKGQRPTVYVYQSTNKFFEHRVDQIRDYAKLAYELLKERKSDPKEFAAKISLGEANDFTPEMLQRFTFKDGNGHWRINELTCVQTLIDYDFYRQMARGMAIDENFFIKKQLDWMDKKFSSRDFVSLERQEAVKKKLSP